MAHHMRQPPPPPSTGVLGDVFRAVTRDLYVTVSARRGEATRHGTDMALLLTLVARLVLVGVPNVHASLSSGTGGRQAVPGSVTCRQH
ncbi:hypothetical protein BD413DRAFT_525064 [Trametes elegans]|nr:hypothetical protein BD413DRAFT_525064 [Trametes elegans]